MNDERPRLRLFLDEGVPDSVGRTFSGRGHEVIYLRDAIARGSPDILVCAAAEANDAVLVALDADMSGIARRHGVGKNSVQEIEPDQAELPRTERSETDRASHVVHRARMGCQ